MEIIWVPGLLAHQDQQFFEAQGPNHHVADSQRSRHWSRTELNVARPPDRSRGIGPILAKVLIVQRAAASEAMLPPSAGGALSFVQDRSKYWIGNGESH